MVVPNSLKGMGIASRYKPDIHLPSKYDTEARTFYLARVWLGVNLPEGIEGDLYPDLIFVL